MPKITGKSITFIVLSHTVTFYNQRCKDWTHPYDYQGNETLSSSGCGIFTLAHCSEWLTGNVQDPEMWGDFACAEGAREDGGTNRPALFSALMRTDRAKELGFHYEEDGLRNDLEALYESLSTEEGIATCNLRVGHIVAVVAAREVDGEKQVLAIDSYSESASEKVRDGVREVIPGSEITYAVTNKNGLVVGESTAYAAFWVKLEQVRDYTLLRKV